MSCQQHGHHGLFDPNIQGGWMCWCVGGTLLMMAVQKPRLGCGCAKFTRRVCAPLLLCVRPCGPFSHVHEFAQRGRRGPMGR